MSLSVSKFTSLRQASLLEQAKDAISAMKEKQSSICPQKGKATKQLPHNQYYKKKPGIRCDVEAHSIAGQLRNETTLTHHTWVNGTYLGWYVEDFNDKRSATSLGCIASTAVSTC